MKRLILLALMLTGLNAGTLIIPPTTTTATIYEPNDFYIGIGVGLREIRETDNLLIGGILGYNYNEYISVEARIQDVQGFGLTTFGVYAKFSYPTDTLEPYILVGGTFMDYTEWNREYDSLTYGIGFDYHIIESIDLFTDIMHYTQPDDHMFLIGLKYNF